MKEDTLTKALQEQLRLLDEKYYFLDHNIAIKQNIPSLQQNITRHRKANKNGNKKLKKSIDSDDSDYELP